MVIFAEVTQLCVNQQLLHKYSRKNNLYQVAYKEFDVNDIYGIFEIWNMLPYAAKIQGWAFGGLEAKSTKLES